MGIMNRLAGLFRQGPPAVAPCVRVGEDGLQVVRGGKVLASVRWSDVKRIIAYKYDCFSTDEICVGLLTSPDAESWLEISEQWPGFREAVARMEARFPSIPEDWLAQVMVPAFERKETVLWEAR